MPPQILRNKETGELAMWDGQNLMPVEGKVVRNKQTGEMALWDGQNLKPIPQGQMRFDSNMTPDQIAMIQGTQQQESPGFFSRVGTEIVGGLEQTGRGIGEIGTGQGSPMSGLNVVGGLARTVFSPATAAGQITGEQYRQGLEPIIGETGANVIGGAADFAMQGIVGGAYGKAGRGLEAVSRKGARFLPGASTGLREEGVALVKRMAGGMKPPVPSGELFDVVSQMNPKVQTPNLLKTAQSLSRSESRVAGVAGKLQSSEIKSIADDIVNNLSPSVGPVGYPVQGVPPKSVDFSVLRSVHRRLGQRINSLRGSTDPKATEQLGAIKRLYAALSKDLETSANAGVGPAYEALKAANQNFRREMVMQELDDMIKPTLDKALEGTDRFNTRFADLYNKIRTERTKNPLFASSKDPFVVKNLDDLEQKLNELRKIPIPPPPKNVNAGSFLRAGQAGTGAIIGGTITSYFGYGPAPGAIMGSAVGIKTSDWITKLLQSEGGRRWLLKFVQKEPGGLFNPQNAAALSMAARAFSMQDISQ